eukprot:961428-Rhodomonas_salina.6
MLFFVPASVLADIGGFIPFNHVEGCPEWAQYPGYHTPGMKINNQEPGAVFACCVPPSSLAIGPVV